MKVSVVPSYRNPKEYTVRIAQEHQSFRLDFHGSRQHAMWMARMFRTALKRHNEERRAREQKSKKNA